MKPIVDLVIASALLAFFFAWLGLSFAVNARTFRSPGALAVCLAVRVWLWRMLWAAIFAAFLAFFFAPEL